MTLIIIMYFLFLTALVNECVDENGGCQQMCSDTAASYVCSCHNGFSLATNEHSCNGRFISSATPKIDIRVNLR